MKKKLFAILLSIVMVAGLLPATVLAAEPTVYDIWVDGVYRSRQRIRIIFAAEQ